MRFHGRLVCCVAVVAAAGALMVFAPGALAAGFGLQSFEVSAVNQNGSPDVQAGSHPYALTTSFFLNQPEEFEPGLFQPQSGGLKDVHVQLPPGFVGDPNATPKCKDSELFQSGGNQYPACPNDTAVGKAETFTLGTGGASNEFFNTVPIYNMEAAPGTAAEFAYLVQGVVVVFLDVSVRTGGDYGLTVRVRNISQIVPVYGSSVTIWGVPADPSHDPLRGKCLGKNEEGNKPNQSRGECPVSVPVLPLLTNPTSCGVPRTAGIEVDSWKGSSASRTAGMPELSGCEKLDFSPSIGVGADGSAGSTPTGLSVDLHVPQESVLNPVGLAESDVKDTTVALPAGVLLSPSAADGLLACSLAQIDLHGSGSPTCPTASKVGTVEIDTPLLPDPLVGSVYLAQQGDLPGNGENPFGSLLALYIVAENKQAGVLVKVAGEVAPNPVTGQLVTTFKETPQLPFGDLKLSFFGSARAPLSTPADCGAYKTETLIASWSGAQVVSPSSTFQITSGPGGAPCEDPQPFTPGFHAGTTNIQADAFSPFSLTMTRPDADQTLASVQMQMPPGLLGTLSSVKLCGEPQAALGTCGEDSLIGHTIVSAGLGNDPYTVTGGKVYITGPYKGAPFGLSIVNPAVAGPFNIGPGGGPIVVRAAINVDPHTAVLRITSDPLPTILQGIPLQLQRVNVTIDRPGFTFNPTSCASMAISGTLSSSEGADAPVSSPFQVTNCRGLGFKPKFVVSTSGHTSRSMGASIDARVIYPTGVQGSQANIARVKVDLPKQLPSRLTTLQKACPAATFAVNPGGCPVASVVGIARASTPVLPVGLTGPVYFVSNGGEAFPNLIVVLQGYGVRVDLVGDTFISRAGITSSTFGRVPDVPINSFELYLPEGKYSALAANGNLCTSSLGMPTAFVAQNGAEIHETTKIAVGGCAKAKKAAKPKRKRAGRLGRPATVTAIGGAGHDGCW